MHFTASHAMLQLACVCQSTICYASCIWKSYLSIFQWQIKYIKSESLSVAKKYIYIYSALGIVWLLSWFFCICEMHRSMGDFHYSTHSIKYTTKCTCITDEKRNMPQTNIYSFTGGFFFFCWIQNRVSSMQGILSISYDLIINEMKNNKNENTKLK